VNSPLVELAIARWRGFYREPSAVFWTFGFPLLLSLALGIAFRNRPPEPVWVAVEQGGGAERLRSALSGQKDVHVELLEPAAARGELRTGKVALVVVPGPPRTYRYDPTRPESRLARAVVDDLSQRADGRRDPTVVADAPVSEPGSRYIDFLIPGLIGMNLMSGGLWGVGYVLVDMRTRKLLKRLMATPMRRWHFLTSFLGLRAIVLAVELPLLLIFASLVFSIGVRGSVVLLTALAALGSLAFAGIGLLIASRAQNTQTVGGLMNLVMMPMFVFSGVFFSASHFPEVMQPVIRALPLTALNDSLRAVMIDGAGLRGVAAPAAVMAGWGIVSFAAALRIFRWR
jgi:ABC-type multidrug transport system permease subunit